MHTSRKLVFTGFPDTPRPSVAHKYSMYVGVNVLYASANFGLSSKM